jgi:hypothetical protein
MKKLFFFTALLCTSCAFKALSQTLSSTIVPRDSAKSIMVQAGKGLTGNLQDVLNNYLQVAAKNLTSSTSNAQLTLNWFALNATDSAEKYKDVNFQKSAWQRNGEFIFSGGIAKTSVFNSFEAGFNYNLLNRRDTAFHYYDQVYTMPFNEENKIIKQTIDHFGVPIIDSLQIKLTVTISALCKQGQPVIDLEGKINSTVTGFAPSVYAVKVIGFLQQQLNAVISNPGTDKTQLPSSLIFWINQTAVTITNQSLGDALNSYVHSLGKQPLKLDAWIDQGLNQQISKYIDDQVAADALLKPLNAKTLADLNKTVMKNYEDLIKYVAQQPLLTFGYNYTYGTGTVLSSHEAGFQYVQGLTPLAAVNTAGLTASLTDTLTGTDPTGKVRNFGRDILALQAGFNQILLVQKKVSVMEINAALEDDQALKGYTTKTDKNTFTLDAYYRVRLPSTPWLKLSIKYDPKTANVFGFFDFTYNIDKQ